MLYQLNHGLSLKALKPTFFLMLFMLLAPVSLRAERSHTNLPGLSLGVKVGYSTTLSFDESWRGSESSIVNQFDYDNASGFCFGGFARFGNRIFIQPELLYIYEKQDVQLVINSASLSKNNELSVIDFPVLLGYKVIDSNLLKLSGLIGPRFRINAGTTFNDNDIVNATHEDITMGLTLGCDLDLMNFVLGVRYNMSPSMTSFEDITNSTNTSSQSTNGFALTLGWILL